MKKLQENKNEARMKVRAFYFCKNLIKTRIKDEIWI
jgi:hypothetical protein